MRSPRQEIFGKNEDFINLLQKDQKGEFTGKIFQGRLLRPILENCLVSFSCPSKLGVTSILPGNIVTKIKKGENGKIEIVTRDGFTYVQSEN